MDDSVDFEPTKIPASKNRKTLLIPMISAIVVASFLGGYVISDLNNSDVVTRSELNSIIEQSQQPSLQRQTSSSSFVFVSADDDPVKGDPNAPLTIIEFSDFQCPFCWRFYTQTLPLIEKNYINTGKVKFVYRDFPIQSIHSNALSAAMASECADEQGKFWEFHDVLFVNQKVWEGKSVPQAAQTFIQYAQDLGLDMNSFNDCFTTSRYFDEINKDFQDGQSYGVTGTPGFFIGNENIGFIKVEGAQPYSVFKQILDKMS